MHELTSFLFLESVLVEARKDGMQQQSVEVAKKKTNEVACLLQLFKELVAQQH